MKENIEKIILENIPDAKCNFSGETCSLKLTVSSKIFCNMPLIKQHKMIMSLLENKFQSGELHALSLETKPH
tara:strand:+ start:762 stop:977 length:216 start_codon:yes stop_codon:yes gene_type:complete